MQPTLLSCLPLRLTSQDEAAGESKKGADFYRSKEVICYDVLFAK